MDILAQACGLGLVTRSEIERGLVEAGSDRGAPTRVLLRGRVVAVVYERREQAAGQLVSLLAAMAEDDLGPRLLGGRDAGWAGGVWVSTVPGRRLAELTGVGNRADLVQLTDACVALGAALACVHRLPVPSCAGRPTPLPDVRRLADHTDGSALDAEVAHAVAADPGLQRAVDVVRDRWSERHWTLGRIEPADIRVDFTAGCRVRFANLDLAGLGNVDWDVAACLACIAQVAGRATSVAWLSEHFWNSYRRAGGPGQLHPQVQAIHAVEAASRAAGRRDSAGVGWWLARAHLAVARTGRPGVLAA